MQEINPDILSIESQESLLRMAREAVTSYLRDQPLPTCQVDDDQLLAKKGVFVSLHRRRGERSGRPYLRGCIGHIISDQPLHRTVIALAIAAATRDPRFEPVQIEEIPDLDFEISVLSPLERIESIDEIAVGRDGLYLTYGNQSGLLLPHVATEYGWDRLEFIRFTCKKAGLSDDTWKESGAIIYRFSTQTFSDSAIS